MSTDFERELSELLHTVTPEPPDYLASPRGAGLPEASRPGAGAAVTELASGTGHAPRRARRWPGVLAAAAAVAALAAGVVAVTEMGETGQRATHRSARPGGVTATGTPNTTAHARIVPGSPPCSSDQVGVARHSFDYHGRVGTARLSYGNRSAKRCTLAPPVVAIGAAPTGGTPFPASAAPLRIPGHGHVVVTARVRVTGRCHAVKRGGLRINVIRAGWVYSFPLRLAGCTLTPLRLGHRMVG